MRATKLEQCGRTRPVAARRRWARVCVDMCLHVRTSPLGAHAGALTNDARAASTAFRQLFERLPFASLCAMWMRVGRGVGCAALCALVGCAGSDRSTEHTATTARSATSASRALAGANSRDRHATTVGHAALDAAEHDRSQARFAPDIPNEYVGKLADPRLKVVGHTIHEGRLGPEWLVAIENVGTETLCNLEMSYAFLDTSGRTLSKGSKLLELPLKRSANGSGVVLGCLGRAEVAMVYDKLVLADVNAALVARVTHDFDGVVANDVRPTQEFRAVGSWRSPDAAGTRISGTLHNDSDSDISYPAVTIFGVNRHGRPLFACEAVERSSVAAGSSWAFATTAAFQGPVSELVVYPRVL